jgi:hypothetical protein
MNVGPEDKKLLFKSLSRVNVELSSQSLTTYLKR